ncbi:hypothetical protein WJ45_09135 [Burkholderia ubonensis]|nr:hypothetical protein WJ45_09135 [Burkholderia ubonensis]KVQ38431.1 hypothetical protein WK04_21430 [Burkholderia ubonensis]
MASYERTQLMDRGYFTVVDARYYGVFATHAGPVAFCDAQQWALCEGHSSTEMMLLPDGRKRFVLKRLNERVLEVVYCPTGVVVDNWSDDECVIDFFAWLHDAMSNTVRSRFVAFYTLSV